MSTSCIHVTALLFRIKAPNRKGLTNPACTSKECVWTGPADKTVVKPKQISDMVWKASKLNKGSSILDFPYRSIDKISYLVTHLMKMSGINSFPFNVEKSEFLAPTLIVKEDVATRDCKFFPVLYFFMFCVA